MWHQVKKKIFPSEKKENRKFQYSYVTVFEGKKLFCYLCLTFFYQQNDFANIIADKVWAPKKCGVGRCERKYLAEGKFNLQVFGLALLSFATEVVWRQHGKYLPWCRPPNYVTALLPRIYMQMTNNCSASLLMLALCAAAHR